MANLMPADSKRRKAAHLSKTPRKEFHRDARDEARSAAKFRQVMENFSDEGWEKHESGHIIPYAEERLFDGRPSFGFHVLSAHLSFIHSLSSFSPLLPT
jgi:hypothetical protein